MVYEGHATKREGGGGGGAREVSPLRKGGRKKVLAMLKGGGGGGAKSFHSLKRGGAKFKSFTLS